jgi:uncharacterized protein DUF3300
MRTGRQVVAWILTCMLLSPSLPATGQEPSKPAFKPEEIDQLVAPIALHPDPLLAQILMASTYPLEIVEAARFAKENAKLTGDQLAEALKQKTWDDSVKSLVTFPQVLTMMNEKLDWLQKLGDAFLAQQQDVMASIQRLRARAQAEGQLKSTKEQNVIVEPSASGPQVQQAPSTVQVVQAPPTVIKIEPTNPEVVYVPSYNPTVVYGAWPPAYPPYYPYPPNYFAAGALMFGAGIAVGAALWGDCDWGHGGGDANVSINNSNNNYNNFSNRVNNGETARNRVEQRKNQAGAGGRGSWQHNPEHRKGVQYRDAATQQRFNKTGPANAQSREAFRGRAQQGSAFGQGGAGARQMGAGGGLGQGGAATRQAGLGQGGFQGDQGGGLQGAGVQGGGRQSGAFEGLGNGRATQSYSNRGNASRESFQKSSGGSRGGDGRASGGGGRRGGGGGGGGGRGGGRR